MLINTCTYITYIKINISLNKRLILRKTCIFKFDYTDFSLWHTLNKIRSMTYAKEETTTEQFLSKNMNLRW